MAECLLYELRSIHTKNDYYKDNDKDIHCKIFINSKGKQSPQYNCQRGNILLEYLLLDLFFIYFFVAAQASDDITAEHAYNKQNNVIKSYL